MATAELDVDLAEENAFLKKELARVKTRIEERAKQERAKWLLVGFSGWTEREAHTRLMRAASRRSVKLSEVIDRLAAMAEAIEELVGEREEGE